MANKILVLDFDGCCTDYRSGWMGVDVCKDPPVPGLWDFLKAAHRVFTLHIYSSRSADARGRSAMIAWFALEGERAGFATCLAMDATVPVVELRTADPTVLIPLYFPEHKPPAFVSLDDRALTFTGVWPQIDDLLQFQPWTAKKQK